MLCNVSSLQGKPAVPPRFGRIRRVSKPPSMLNTKGLSCQNGFICVSFDPLPLVEHSDWRVVVRPFSYRRRRVMNRFVVMLFGMAGCALPLTGLGATAAWAETQKSAPAQSAV